MPSPTKDLSIINQPVAHQVMDIYDALRAIYDGQQITKLEWADQECYGVLRDSKVMLHKPDGLFYDWIISEGDLAGTDWVILE